MYDLLHMDRVLALWWTDVETLNETSDKEEGLLTTEDLSEARTLSCKNRTQEQGSGSVTVV